MSLMYAAPFGESLNLPKNRVLTILLLSCGSSHLLHLRPYCFRLLSPSACLPSSALLLNASSAARHLRNVRTDNSENYSLFFLNEHKKKKNRLIFLRSNFLCPVTIFYTDSRYFTQGQFLIK